MTHLSIVFFKTMQKFGTYLFNLVKVAFFGPLVAFAPHCGPCRARSNEERDKVAWPAQLTIYLSVNPRFRTTQCKTDNS